jgi:hypothetical protein
MIHVKGRILHSEEGEFSWVWLHQGVRLRVRVRVSDFYVAIVKANKITKLVGFVKLVHEALIQSVYGVGIDGLQHHESTDPVARGLGLVTSMWKLSKQTKLRYWLCL